MDSFLFEYPAQDICSLTHRILWSLLLFPLLLLSRVFWFIVPEHWKQTTLSYRSFVGFLFGSTLVLGWILGARLLLLFFPKLSDVTIVFLALPATIILIAGLALLIGTAIFLWNKLGSTEIRTPGYHIIKSIKDKTCSKIDWE